MMWLPENDEMIEELIYQQPDPITTQIREADCDFSGPTYGF